SLILNDTNDTNYLHSFPTRRSSDLDRLGVRAQRRHAHGGATHGEIRLAEHFAHFPAHLHLLDGVAVLVEAIDLRHHVEGEGMREDRKSTRLNSSHRTISYAVFCLKK